MLYINTRQINQNSCAYFFGLEEYLIKDYKFTDDIFLLWTVNPSVMIGRHQVTSFEIDEKFVKDNNIEIIRRNSGGGAVYTDHGCIQFSFITDKKNHTNIFESHVSKIITAIRKLGIDAVFTGRNDILVNGRKFSGNAEYIYKDKMVVHGTILFNSNFDNLIGSLTPDKSKLTKHAISSVKARVINIGTLLDTNIGGFCDYLIDEIKTSEINVKDLDKTRIHQYESKFYKQEWNFGKNPKYEFTNKLKFDAGNITVYAEIKKNIIRSLKINGDYFSLKKIQDLENAFIGVEFNRSAFLEITKQFKIREYLYKLKTSEFLELFFGKVEKKYKTKPDYLKIDMRDLNKQTKKIRALLKENNLFTVCQEASCPNQLECFSNNTATFMILGNKCTRNCRFCDVENGQPLKPDPKEPDNLVKAVKIMNLKHIVVTSVTRDDLEDYGSEQFVKVINKLKSEVPNTTIEVLIPDFMGDYNAIKRVVDAKPDVINHNLETIKRLYPGFRDNASYERSLSLLNTVKELDKTILTKSGIMVGIGETNNEIFDLMVDLREIKCDILTIGQYLQPSKEHVEVKEYVSLEDFKLYENQGKEMGFRYITSGPLVRSSYHAYKQFKGE
jgi:lipoic acid synthetase